MLQVRERRSTLDKDSGTKNNNDACRAGASGEGGMKKIVSSVAAAIIAFVVVKYGVEEFRLRLALHNAEAWVREAPLKHPDVAPSEAMQSEAKNRLAAKLGSASSETEKQKYAADTF